MNTRLTVFQKSRLTLLPPRHAPTTERGPPISEEESPLATNPPLAPNPIKLHCHSERVPEEESRWYGSLRETGIPRSGTLRARNDSTDRYDQAKCPSQLPLRS